jgi:peptidoglycan/LPS O-acetylase OafA/YrhL
VRRIFPALLVVLIATLALGWFVLLGPEFRPLGERAAGGAAFVTNFLFLNTRGYFATLDTSEPLLHLWSLAIEEQFYIVWPLLFYIAWRTRLNLMGAVALLTTASLTLNLWTVRVNGAAFFLPTTRAWELGVGGLLAVTPPSLAVRERRVLREWMAAAGLVGMILAIELFDRDMDYPSALTLIPVLAAALSITAGPTAWLNRRILSWPLLVGCGLVSYPLYLWHWPLLSLGHILTGQWFSPRRRVVVALVSLLLAVLTYLAVERPIRFGRRGGLKALALLVLMFGLGCLGLVISSGRVPSASQLRGVDPKLTDKLFAAAVDWEFPGRRSEPVNGEEAEFVRYVGRPDWPEVWFFGDSNVEQYGPRIEKLIAAHPQEFPSAVFTVKGGCVPLPNIMWARFRHLCEGFIERAMEYARGAKISTVVVGAAWPYVVDGVTYLEKVNVPAGVNIADVTYRELEELLWELRGQGKTVYLLLPIPIDASLDPERMIRRRLSLYPFAVSFAIPDRPGMPAGKPGVPALQERLRMIAARTGARVIDPYDYLCRNGFCPAFDEAGQPIYKDEDHLRAAFVREKASFIDRVLSDR